MKTRFVLTWHDLDANEFNTKEYVNTVGKDHSGSMDALSLAQVIDSNAWPWKIEKVMPEGGNSELSMSNWGGDEL